MADGATEFLTTREMVVLRRLARPGTKADIAREMFVSVNTIKSHVKQIYAKLGVGDRRQAVSRGQALGIVVPDRDDRELELDPGSEFVLTACEAMQYLLDTVRIYDKRDRKLFDRIHRADVRWESPVSSCSGVAGMWDRAMELATAVPDLDAELVGLIVDEGRNAASYEYSVTGTHLGPLCVRDRWYPATGKRFRYTSMAIVTFDDSGLVSEVRSYFDFIDIVRQVGLVVG
jgi:DNA-binding CsgD family transcriptional regulator/predicted ester cyclase